MNDPRQRRREVERGRCVQCGRIAELVALAAGFTGLGWCADCDRKNREPMFTLAEAWPQ